MLSSFRNAHFDKLAEFWNEHYPKAYHIDAELLELNTTSCPVFDWGASVIDMEGDEVRGFLAVKRSANPALYPGADWDEGHLSAIVYSQPRVGVDLLAEAKKILRNRGLARLVFGRDSRHFFPGCPLECHWLRDFLMVEGFEEGGKVYDLQRDITDYDIEPDAPKGVELRALKESDMPALEEFFCREFPGGRWEYDVKQKIKAEGGLDCVFGLFKDGRIEGFALTQDGTQKLPIGGAIWRNNMGQKWGSLGPIGITRSLRRQGLGHAMVAAAIQGMKEKGIETCVVDWTNILPFYERHGFEVAHTYRTLVLNLDSR